MRMFPLGAALASIIAMVAACKKQDDGQTTAAPTATGAYPGYAPGYPPPQGTAQYPQPQPTYQQYPPPASPTAPGPMPTATAPAGTGQMAVPGPIAFPCQNDVQCGLHHCNVQYGKCAFPCQSAVDCIPPNQCMGGMCLPTMPGATPPAPQPH